MHRQPAVAGAFYPANPARLREVVAGHLQAAAPAACVRPPKAVIVPHAGYVYSGPVAASAYARLAAARATISRVVLVGPAHRVACAGLALSPADAFLTPLGQVAVDRQAPALLDGLAFVSCLEAVHRFEHSLEVQLPFLQQVLADFSIVPVLAGDATPAQVEQVLARLWGGPETLVVISSDLSHYHDYATARRLDKATAALIERLCDELPPEAACGRVAVGGLLRQARRLGLSVRAVDVRNSGDTGGGDRRRVVGYGAFVVD